MKQQLSFWEGEFGKQYTDRNIVDWRVRLPAFHKMLEGLMEKSGRVLEVGCNRGHNLRAVSEILGPSYEIVGIEPNLHALKLAKNSVHFETIQGNVFEIPFPDESCDLVFTVGVLIHIPIADLPSALKEIYRVSKRYILAIEYFAEDETMIPYRGQDDRLWKRNFLKHYQIQFAGLSLIRAGYCGFEEGFDRVNWWMLEKVGD